MTRKYKIARINCGCVNCPTIQHRKIILYAERDSTGQYQIIARQAQPRPDIEWWNVETPYGLTTLASIRKVVEGWYSSSADWGLEWWDGQTWMG